ncbi:glycosyltransferase family 4 protein [uncultured Alistipes sp.]|uniref:glycosyltransferase family 4 protein n=1 Tax=uncultured Alistipes sp. TaxID=538949 RepID=UPI0025FC995D|nr:glycosyltransferase [uncultured Alistipes sp.]
MKLKIFISAYACEPGLGSEIGVGWHWVLEMSKYFELWVLTRESNRSTIEPWIEAHPEYADIRFLYYDLPRWARFWKKGLRGVRIYYNIWQLRSDRIVRHTMRQHGIEIFHHLTYGNFLWRVCRSGRSGFFIWGPGSAGSVVPKEFSRRYSLRSRIKEALQRWMRRTLPCNRSFKRRCADSSLILCKTRDTLACIPAGACKAVLFTDVAVQLPAQAGGQIPPEPRPGPVKYLAAGSLDGWRGFDVLIEAFSRALAAYPGMELEILGAGPEYRRLRRLIAALGTGDRIRLSGKVPPDVYRAKMSGADVVVNPCLREGAVTMAFDSMSLGKPLLCVETGGYTRYFTDSYAVIIPLGKRLQTVDSMVAGILSLTDPSVRAAMGVEARLAAGKYTWEHKGREICETITKAYSEWQKERTI